MINSFLLFLLKINYQTTLGHLNGNCYFIRKINSYSFENFIKPGDLCNEIMNAMLVLKVSKHKTYNFQKFLIFLIFQKFEKSGMLHNYLAKASTSIGEPSRS